MSSINFVRSEYTTWCYHSDWKFAFFHNMNLSSAGLCTKKEISVYVECILLILCRVISRDIQCFKVIIVCLYLRSFNNLIAHADKYSLNFFHGYYIGMAVTYRIFLCRKSNINDLSLHLCLALEIFHLLDSFLKNFFNLGSCLIDKLSNFWSVLGSNILHAL